MTPQAFIAKWRDNPLTERAGAQAHFEDLCDLLGVDKPRDSENYCYERGVTKTGAAQGWADVWKKNCFAWEYKAPGRDLGAALKQLMTYALALDNPPLLVVSDRRRIEIHTHFTGTPSEVHDIPLEDIGQPHNLQKLRWLFNAPERFKPSTTTYAVTEEAARKMGKLAERLNARGHDPLRTAHFLIQCVFCMFAEDARLLPEKLFETVLEKSNPNGEKAQRNLTTLFGAMRKGGDFGADTIPYFNGGLFEQIDVPPLATEDVVQLLDCARMDWGAIEPAILGTLFERGLNPDMRSQLGAHYTDPATILKLIRPVIEAPLLAEWQPVKNHIAELMQSYVLGGKGSQVSIREAQAAFTGFIQRLKNYRVLDPACGSGNFLYLALKTLKNIEHRANLEAEALGLHRELTIETSPINVLGIELNPYAAELARVTVWIGEIQWMLAHGYPIKDKPILQPLDHIENRDAVLNFSMPSPTTFWSSEPEWPTADAVVGNPPFLGDKKMLAQLGHGYAVALRAKYNGRVPGGADFVTYWFEKARAQIEQGLCQRAGLVATNSIRGGASRKVLERIAATAPIFEAWSDEAWINNGAAVRVSLVCFGAIDQIPVGYRSLNGQPVHVIHADLSGTKHMTVCDSVASPLSWNLNKYVDLTLAKPTQDNANTAYSGIQKTGPFDIAGTLARSWLSYPNPHGKANSLVVKPWSNGLDITRRNQDNWIIDFGTDMPEHEASLFETPFAYAIQHVKPTRVGKREKRTNEMWWIFQWSRPKMRAAIAGLPRFIVTPEVSKHRVFKWLTPTVVPDKNLIVIARADDTTFGILHSRFHELWSLRLGTSLEDRPRYTPTTTFETFPFPAGLTPRDTPAGPQAEAIAAAAKQLNALREAWLNPPEWVDSVRTKEEEQAGFPLRPVAKPGHEAELKKRTLTNLYNARPAWLDNAHRELDAAVAAAYGCADYTPEMPDEEILKRLLALNLERAG